MTSREFTRYPRKPRSYNARLSINSGVVFLDLTACIVRRRTSRGTLSAILSSEL